MANFLPEMNYQPKRKRRPDPRYFKELSPIMVQWVKDGYPDPAMTGDDALVSLTRL